MNASINEIKYAEERGESGLRRILVPLDLSGSMFASLAHASSLSRGMESAVTLLHVVEVDLSGRDNAAHTPERIDEKCQAVLAQLQVLADQLWQGERRVEVAVAVGDPCAQIIQQAGNLDADLIVMTTKKHGGMFRHVRRDTTARVMRDSPCPVMVAPIYERADRQEVYAVAAT